MKWLRKFEELSPELIRRTGVKLIDKGHSERGLDLLDKSNPNTLNIWMTDRGNHSGSITVNDESHPAPLKYYYSNSEFNFFPKNMTWELKDANYDAEKLVESWKKGICDLSFNIDIFVKPTKETIKKISFNKDNFDRPVPLFCINFKIHDKISDTLKSRINKDSVYIQNYFDKYKNESLITLDFPCVGMKSNSGSEYGLFSDRKSAFYFRNIILPKVMDEHGDKIMEVLSIINMKADKASEILEFYKIVKLNYLYRSEIPHYVFNHSEVDNYLFKNNKEKDIRT